MNTPEVRNQLKGDEDEAKDSKKDELDSVSIPPTLLPKPTPIDSYSNAYLGIDLILNH